MKRIVLLLIACLLSMMSAQAVDFYTSFNVSGSQGLPDSVYVEGAECGDTLCSEIASKNVEIYSGQAHSCLIGASNDELTSQEFESCISPHKINNGIASLQDTNQVITKVTTPSDFGYLTYFSASNDQYLPYYVEQKNFNCDFDICVDPEGYSINFEKKNGGIAEIGQVNLINTNDNSKPVQVRVPVDIEQTVCSAYTLTLDNAWKPSINDPYSDFNADTSLEIEIVSDEDGTTLFSEQTTLSIPAEECSSLQIFEWTPSSSLENESVTVNLETDVIDSQVINSQKDYASVQETVYPINLDNTCWARIEDFTLTNDPNTQLTSSIAQISEGEELYATLDAGAYKDNDIVPTQYNLEIIVDGQEFYSQTHSTNSVGLTEHTIDLTDIGSILPVGDYDVIARATPQASNCELQEPVTHTQQLSILENMRYDLFITVRNESFDTLEDANVDIELLEADEDFAQTPQYNNSLQTSSTGLAQFEELYAGTYSYEVSKSGYASKSDEIVVGSDTELFVTLRKGNQAPVIDLPSSFDSQVNQDIVVDLEMYVRDANEQFSSLDLSTSVVSGEGQSRIENGNLIISSSTIGNSVIEVGVEDSQGLTASDSTLAVFSQGNESAPVVNLPENFESPVNEEVVIDLEQYISDENDAFSELQLDQSILSGTGQSRIENGNLIVSSSQTGIVVVEVEAEDSVGLTGSDSTNIFFSEGNEPSIDSFVVFPNSGEVPLNVTFSIRTSDSDNDTLTCTLDFDDSTVPIMRNCNNLTRVNHIYNDTGRFNPSLEVSDSSNTVYEETQVRVLERKIPRDYQPLEESSVTMNVEEEVEPGVFSFDVRVSNETLEKRNLFVQPEIVCDGVRSSVTDGGGLLSDLVVSKEERGSHFNYTLQLDTLDFDTTIPKDQPCELEVTFVDSVNTTVTASDSVQFSYEEEPSTMMSIRGETSDIISYMDIALDNVYAGYNSHSFILMNNEEDNKEITMTLTSRELSLNRQLSFGLDPNSEREVSLSFFVGEVEPGQYPVRISINDGEEHQTRYSYINVVEE